MNVTLFCLCLGLAVWSLASLLSPPEAPRATGSALAARVVATVLFGIAAVGAAGVLT